MATQQYMPCCHNFDSITFPLAIIFQHPGTNSPQMISLCWGLSTGVGDLTKMLFGQFLRTKVHTFILEHYDGPYS